jgi:hypothetical protein
MAIHHRLILFISGYIINKTADKSFAFQKDKSGGNIVPEGWLFNHISSPHYFGEIVEWGGWALMTWSLPVCILVYTFANLSRELSAHIVVTGEIFRTILQPESGGSLCCLSA